MIRKTLTIDGLSFNALSWIGPGAYDKHGQLLAALEIDGGVYFEDFSRGLGYFLPGCELNTGYVMHRYNYNERCECTPPSCKWVDRDNQGLNQYHMRDALRGLALSLVD